MSKINRRYIDKHWLIYVLRGSLAALFGLLMVFNCLNDTSTIALPIGIFLLCIGAMDSVSAIYRSHKRHGWINALTDAVVDVLAAIVLLFVGRDSLVASVVILAVYTLISGIIDIFQGAVATVDPTDKFIRILVGAFGCVIGVVIFNAGAFDVIEFYRFFGVYVLMLGITNLIYGAHNRAQIFEARDLMRELAHDHAKAEELAKDEKTAESGHPLVELPKKSEKSEKSKNPEKSQKTEKSAESKTK